MSLSDIIPAVLKTRLTKRAQGRATTQRRWQLKNREHLRAYKREWDRKRKLKR